ncbi:hypothetical protein TBR22_A10180 [Luteitalea sp. TBR-22]|uniref:hypothetical protein n=1 Tax=Luteitalea sp. TBR-22 TaxID=2802971 RepID=UPI001AF2766D|nr:hypothetical protein [Luteitalea sp. TBR-22]BCS31814.1 hypothetical protein TBR22_A10180 [Luteitalea sp. TBR-22]
MTKLILRASLVACGLLALAPLAAQAQEQVTVVRRGSQKISGRFEDWNRATDTVYVRVTQNDQQKFPMADVQLIDVGGNAENLPAAEVQQARGSDHILVTRSGEVLRGRLINIEGGQGSAKENEPRVVSFQAGGQRRFRLSEVARIYLGAYNR